eukprot:1709-Heterococcus_DN1.PRE.1
MCCELQQCSVNAITLKLLASSLLCVHAARADDLQAVADIGADSDKMAIAVENAVPRDDADAAVDVTALQLEGAGSPTGESPPHLTVADHVKDVAEGEQPHKLAAYHLLLACALTRMRFAEAQSAASNKEEQAADEDLYDVYIGGESLLT